MNPAAGTCTVISGKRCGRASARSPALLVRTEPARLQRLPFGGEPRPERQTRNIRRGRGQVDLEAHQLVTPECMQAHPVTGLVPRQEAVEVARRQLQAVQRDQHVAGRQPRSLRRPVVEHLGQPGFAVAARQLDPQRRPVARRFEDQRHPEIRQQTCERQILRPGHRLFEPVRQFASMTPVVRCVDFDQLGNQPEHVRLADPDPGLSVPHPQHPHQIVEAASPAAQRAQLQVQGQRDQRALGVVAHDRIRRVFILAIVLRPCVEGRFGHALPQAPAAALHGRDRLGEQAEIVLDIDHAGTQQRQIVVIRGKTFEHPQQPGVVLTVERIGNERGRFDAFHVPGMEILVAAQPQKCLVSIRQTAHARERQIAPVGQQRGRGAVLEAAIALSHDHRHEEITLDRRRRAEQADLPGADLLQIGTQALEIAVVPAGDRDFMAHPASIEMRLGERAHFDRVIDQLVIVGRPVAAEALRTGPVREIVDRSERGRHAPVVQAFAGRRQDIDRARFPGLALDREEHARAIEEPVGAVQMRRAHGEIPRIHFAAHRQRGRGGQSRRAPGVLVELFEHHRVPAGLGADRHDVARELANHVATWYPCRQAQDLAGRVGRGHAAGHPEQMRFGPKGFDGVVHAAIGRHDRVCAGHGLGVAGRCDRF